MVSNPFTKHFVTCNYDAPRMSLMYIACTLRRHMEIYNFAITYYEVYILYIIFVLIIVVIHLVLATELS